MVGVLVSGCCGIMTEYRLEEMDRRGFLRGFVL